MGGCYSPIQQKQSNILKQNVVNTPPNQLQNIPNPEEQPVQQQDSPLTTSIIVDEEIANQQTITHQSIKQSAYYSKLHHYNNQKLNVCQPSQAGLSVIQRLQMQDPDSMFFKGIPKNIDKSNAIPKINKTQAKQTTSNLTNSKSHLISIAQK